MPIVYFFIFCIKNRALDFTQVLGIFVVFFLYTINIVFDYNQIYFTTSLRTSRNSNLITLNTIEQITVSAGTPRITLNYYNAYKVGNRVVIEAFGTINTAILSGAGEMALFYIPTEFAPKTTLSYIGTLSLNSSSNARTHSCMCRVNTNGTIYELASSALAMDTQVSISLEYYV